MLQRIETRLYLFFLGSLLSFTPVAQEARLSAGDHLQQYPQVRQAIEDLAQRTSRSPADVEVVSVEEVVWPDSSLGCPQPGMRYSQVLQDGMRIILQANDRRYAYHSGGSRAPFLCERKTRQQRQHPLELNPGAEEDDR